MEKLSMASRILRDAGWIPIWEEEIPDHEVKLVLVEIRHRAESRFIYVSGYRLTVNGERIKLLNTSNHKEIKNPVAWRDIEIPDYWDGARKEIRQLIYESMRL